jgi:hypothetical protein
VPYTRSDTLRTSNKLNGINAQMCGPVRTVFIANKRRIGALAKGIEWCNRLQHVGAQTRLPDGMFAAVVAGVVLFSHNRYPTIGFGKQSATVKCSCIGLIAELQKILEGHGGS